MQVFDLIFDERSRRRDNDGKLVKLSEVSLPQDSRELPNPVSV